MMNCFVASLLAMTPGGLGNTIISMGGTVDKHSIGIVGLGVMGENLALNFESKGFSLAGYDLDSKKVDNFKKRTAGKKTFPAYAPSGFLNALESPRRILIMVP